MNDEELLRRLRRGCRRSLATLIERHQGPLRAFAMVVAPRPDLADDIAQETLLRAVDRHSLNGHCRCRNPCSITEDDALHVGRPW